MRFPIRLILLASAALAAASGCVSVVPPAEYVESSDQNGPTVDPCRVVLIVEGMLHDLGASWDERLQGECSEAGVLAIRLRYFTSPFGVWFNWGSILPGRALADLADSITDLHAESGCARPLELYGVGFSHGCEVFLRALPDMRSAHFKRLALLHSSSFAWSYAGDRLVRDGQVTEPIQHWYSAIDGTTLFAPLGAGSFGMRTRNASVVNRHHLRPHLARCLTASVRSDVLQFLLGTAPKQPLDKELTPDTQKYRDGLKQLLRGE